MVGDLVSIVQKSRVPETQAQPSLEADTQQAARHEIRIELTEEQLDAILRQSKMVNLDEPTHITFYVGQRVVGELTTEDARIRE